jgi:hypothetical protein
MATKKSNKKSVSGKASKTATSPFTRDRFPKADPKDIKSRRRAPLKGAELDAALKAPGDDAVFIIQSKAHLDLIKTVNPTASFIMFGSIKDSDQTKIVTVIRRDLISLGKFKQPILIADERSSTRDLGACAVIDDLRIVSVSPKVTLPSLRRIVSDLVSIVSDVIVVAEDSSI